MFDECFYALGGCMCVRACVSCSLHCQHLKQLIKLISHLGPSHNMTHTHTQTFLDLSKNSGFSYYLTFNCDWIAWASECHWQLQQILIKHRYRETHWETGHVLTGTSLCLKHSRCFSCGSIHSHFCEIGKLAEASTAPARQLTSLWGDQS